MNKNHDPYTTSNFHRFFTHFDPTWAPFWHHLGAILGPLGAIWVHFGSPGGDLGASWTTFGLPWAYVGLSWAHLEPIWRHFGTILGPFKDPRELFGDHFGGILQLSSFFLPPPFCFDMNNEL